MEKIMGRPVVDLTGQQFNRLTVIRRDMTKPVGAGKSAYWLCQCSCGNQKSVRTDKLRNGDIQSCGCLSKETRTKLFLNDLTGQKFGKLTVVKRDDSKQKGKACFAYWICQCECGNTTSVRGDHLRDHTIVGCGCTNSKGELKIRQLLDSNKIKYQQQYSFSDLKVKDLLRFDFAIFEEEKIKCLIEYQGEQHYKKAGYDTEDRFKIRKSYDKLKRKYCKDNNILLIEIPYTDYEKLNIDYLRRCWND